MSVLKAGIQHVISIFPFYFKSSTSRKQYIVVGMTEKKSKEDCQSTLDKVENILLGTLKKGLENVRNILDDVGSNVSKR